MNAKKTTSSLFILILLSTFFYSCNIVLSVIFNTETTNNEVIQIVESPDEKYIAYVYIRNINTTTKESYHLTILETGENLRDKKGNVFVTYGNFKAKWNSANELEIFDLHKGEIFKQKTKYKNIIITYRH